MHSPLLIQSNPNGVAKTEHTVEREKWGTASGLANLEKEEIDYQTDKDFRLDERVSKAID